jgi:hypothetical protein
MRLGNYASLSQIKQLCLALQQKSRIRSKALLRGGLQDYTVDIAGYCLHRPHQIIRGCIGGYYDFTERFPGIRIPEDTEAFNGIPHMRFKFVPRTGGQFYISRHIPDPVLNPAGLVRQSHITLQVKRSRREEGGNKTGMEQGFSSGEGHRMDIPAGSDYFF